MKKSNLEQEKLAGTGVGNASLPGGLESQNTLAWFRLFLAEIEAMVGDEPELRSRLAAIYLKVGGAP